MFLLNRMVAAAARCLAEAVEASRDCAKHYLPALRVVRADDAAYEVVSRLDEWADELDPGLTVRFRARVGTHMSAADLLAAEVRRAAVEAEIKRIEGHLPCSVAHLTDLRMEKLELTAALAECGREAAEVEVQGYWPTDADLARGYEAEKTRLAHLTYLREELGDDAADWVSREIEALQASIARYEERVAACAGKK